MAAERRQSKRSSLRSGLHDDEHSVEIVEEAKPPPPTGRFVVLLHNGALATSDDWTFCSFGRADTPPHWNILRSATVPVRLMEVVSHRPDFGSWLLVPSAAGGDGSWRTATVVEDGSLYCATPFDPLFLALYQLEPTRMSSSKMFQPLDVLLMDTPGDLSLEKVISPNKMAKICDRKDFGEEAVFRLSHERVMEWLVCKVNRLIGLGMSLTTADALLLLSDYLPPFWFDALKNAHGGAEKPGSSQGVASAGAVGAVDLAARYKRPRDDEDGGAVLSSAAPAGRKAVSSAAIRRLAKADTRGMSSLASYFVQPKK